jgi:hypothetical protein
MNDEKELRRRLEALRLKHNDANDLSLTHDCLFADLIAVVDILARGGHCGTADLTGPKKPTKPAMETAPVACGDCGGTGLLLSGQQCSDCRGKGYL